MLVSQPWWRMLESGNTATNIKSPTSMQTQTTRELKNTSANETLILKTSSDWLIAPPNQNRFEFAKLTWWNSRPEIALESGKHKYKQRKLQIAMWYNVLPPILTHSKFDEAPKENMKQQKSYQQWWINSRLLWLGRIDVDYVRIRSKQKW